MKINVSFLKIQSWQYLPALKILVTCHVTKGIIYVFDIKFYIDNIVYNNLGSKVQLTFVNELKKEVTKNDKWS